MTAVQFRVNLTLIKDMTIDSQRQIGEQVLEIIAQFNRLRNMSQNALKIEQNKKKHNESISVAP